MLTFLGSFVTPALVASLFALTFNARAEKRRDLRTAISKRIDESRLLVSNAVNAAASYFSLDAANRTPQLEAQLWMAEREVRLGLHGLTERADTALDVELAKLQLDFDFFVSELTGGNFQQKDAVADISQIQRIAGLGAELRQSISKANEADFEERLSSDLISRVMKRLELRPYYAPLQDADFKKRNGLD